MRTTRVFGRNITRGHVQRAVVGAIAAVGLIFGITATPVSAHIEAGSTTAMQLNQPVVGIAATPSGHGYWRVAADGGIFTYGDAEFFGSLGSVAGSPPTVGVG